MVHSLGDVLRRKDFDEPPEMRAIKSFVQDAFQTSVEVLIRERDIVIICSSASLANSLRLKSLELRAAIDTEKKLIFRIR